MAISNNTNDVSDIFWPGYVDAVVNLAINLLFVIAVMAIVVFGATLKITELTKIKPLVPPPPQKTIDIEVLLQDIKKATADKLAAEKTAKEKSISLTQTENELVATQTALKESRLRLAQLQAQLTEVNNKINEASAKASMMRQSVTTLRQTPSGTMVVFGVDSVDLTDSETNDLLNKMASIAPLKTIAWRISVIYPKGFADASKLAHQRANSIRNTLIRNDIPAGVIEMRVVESAQATANSARVMISAAQ